MRRVLCGFVFLSSVCWSLPSLATEPPNLVDQAQPEPDQTEKLWEMDQQVKRNAFAIQPHKRTYFTVSYFDSNFSSTEIDASAFDNALEHAEIKFQVSMRVPIVEGLMGSDADVYVAYTSKSLWQAFNSDASSPFRDINHEPEVFVLVPTQWTLGPIRSRAFTFGFNHQSNGQTNRSLVTDDGEVVYESLSRSWNRLMLGAYFEQKNFRWHLQTWYRIPEEEKESPSDAKGDDNPDLEDYMGNFELTVEHLIKERLTSTFSVRNNLDRDENHGAVFWGMSFPLTRKVNGMVQLFHGYGETLLDYDSRTTRVGVGITLRGF